MAIDNTTSLEVRPLVMETIVENGESVVTLAEKSDINLNVLTVQNFTHDINVFNISNDSEYEVTTTVNPTLLSTALFNPSEEIIPGGFSGTTLTTLGVDVGSGEVRSLKYFCSVFNGIDELVLNENNDIVHIYGSLVLKCAMSSFSGDTFFHTYFQSETVVENDVEKIVALNGYLDNCLKIRITADALKAALPQVDDQFIIEYVTRDEGLLVAPKVTGLDAPVQGSDAVNLEFMTSEVDTLEAADAAQIAHINEEVANLIDRINNQDNVIAYSTQRWASPKAVLSEGYAQINTKALLQFDDMVDGFIPNSATASDLKATNKSFKVDFYGLSHSFAINEVNSELAPGIYQFYANQNQQISFFPACTYGGQEAISSDMGTSPNLFDVRYYADQEALNSNNYTVVASSIPLQSTIIVDVNKSPNWYVGTYLGNTNVLPSYVTVKESDFTDAGCINTIPGFFSWHQRLLQSPYDNSPQSMHVRENPPGQWTGMTLVVTENAQKSTSEVKFGSGALRLPSIDQSFAMIPLANKTNLRDGYFCIEGWFKFDSQFMNDSSLIFGLTGDTVKIFNNPWQISDLILRKNSVNEFVLLVKSDFNELNNVQINEWGFDPQISPDTWYHIALVCNNKVMSVFINGENKLLPDGAPAQLNSISQFMDTNVLYVGGHSQTVQEDNPCESTVGYIDCVRVTSGDPVYTENFTVPTATLKSDQSGMLISFPDMSVAGLSSNIMGVVLANPEVDEPVMTEEELIASRMRKVYTSNIMRDVVEAWQSPEGDVFAGPNGDLVEVAPTSGRIFKVGQKINSTDMMVDLQDYGFISGVTAKRKRFDFGALENVQVLSFALDSKVDNLDGTFAITLKACVIGLSSGKVKKASNGEEVLLNDNIVDRVFNGIVEFTMPASSTETFNLMLNDSSEIKASVTVTTGPAGALILNLDALNYSGSGDWIDISGNDCNATLINDPTWNSIGYFNFVGNQYASVPTNKLVYGDTPTTIISWVRFSEFGNNPNWIFTYGDYANSATMGAWSWAFWCGQIDSDIYGGSPQTNTWYHVARVFDNSTGVTSVYVNGELVASGTLPNLPSEGEAWIAKQITPYSEEYLNGRIATLSMYSAALPQSTILADYNNRSGQERFHYSDTSLSTFQINGQDAWNGAYLTVPYGTTSVTVTAIPTYSYASVTRIAGDTGLVTGVNSVEVDVTAGDGTILTYFLAVEVMDLSSDTSLSVFQINGQNVYDGGTLVVEPGTTSVTVTATPNHPNASVASITGDTGLVIGNNTVLVEVVSEKGTSYTHSVIVNVMEVPLGAPPTPVITNVEPVYNQDGTVSLKIYYTPSVADLESGTFAEPAIGVSLNGGASLDAGNVGRGNNPWSTMNPHIVSQRLVNNEWTWLTPGATFNVKIRFSALVNNQNYVTPYSNEFVITV